MSDFYNGNMLVKRAGIEHEFDIETIRELQKCSTDIAYFVKTYCKIITLDHGLQLFKPYAYQENMIDVFHNNRFVVSLLPRQMGKSTIVAAYLLHYAMFNPEVSIGILANKAATSREILSRIQRMYEHLPFWMQLGVKEWNKGTVILANDSKILAAATSSDSIRGQSLNVIYLDEFAHVEQQNEFWESTYPVISSGENSKVIITSTPKGMELFYKIYTQAESGANNFVAIKVNWWDHPKRDEAWKQETLKNIGEDQFKQEFECEFLGSSGTLISGDKLKSMFAVDPIMKFDNIRQYEAAQKDKVYVLIADVSRGKGLDYSTFSVIDVSAMPYKQICTFRDNMISPVDFADVINRIGKIYNDAQVLIEINDIGGQVADVLFLDFGYENILFTESQGRSGKRISGGFGKSVDRGIRTTKTVKAIGCSILKLLIEQNQLLVYDHNTIEEFKRFSKSNFSYAADPGEHDDMIMTLVLFSWLSNQSYFKDMTDINTLVKLREKTEEQMGEEMLPFGYINSGTNSIESPLYKEFEFDF